MERKAKQVLLTSAFASALLFMPTHGKAAEWKLGMSHPQIKEVQALLKAKGFFTYPTPTGYFGTMTETAVKKFQASVRLPVTGVVDAKTYAALKGEKKKENPSTKASPSFVAAEWKVGASGEAVKTLQERLKVLGYFTYSQVTGYFGTMTEEAVKTFQKDVGLAPTGIADRSTLAKLEEALRKKTKPTILLTIGASGEQIKTIQIKLKQLGHFTYPEVTGYFGQATAEAVKKFQANAQLPVTGIVDDTTYTRLLQVQKPFDPIELVADAAPLLGKPYVWGGQTPDTGFDCSGLIFYLFQQQGISLPRTVIAMWNAGTSVDAPAVGDIVFFQTEGTTASHAGIYIGNNQFLHSASSTGVTISAFNSPYWSARYIGAKRYW
ncbi:C40 family peptidase [Anoxybacteroides amylolyticum]|uniref:Putative peptidoglycan binding domain protein n=1 Tax=Anoxybacteroides amylolyticum TaxID=294699 RepID=A0A167T5P3_9BACL|nr:peptidoglycan-binding protein [Anoxybacillus amylolyticus]ANB59490.1 putative peptidoglycan binding domain protein [Anoxybacillus amylolyticus]